MALLGVLALIYISNALEITIDGYTGGNVSINMIPVANSTFFENVTAHNNTVRIQDIPNGSYYVVVKYGGKQYVTSISIPEDSKLRINFGETDDINFLRIGSIHFILNTAQNTFAVMEVINFENTADRYFHGDIIKKIPEGASHVVVDEQSLMESGMTFDNLIQKNDSIVIKNATVQPNGIFSLAYLYFPSNSIQLVVDYPAGVVRIIHPVGIKITAPSMFKQETQIQDAQGTVFNVLRANNLSRGVYEIKAEMQVSNTSSPMTGYSSPVNIPLIAGIGLIVAGVILLFMTTRKRDEEERNKDEEWKIQ